MMHTFQAVCSSIMDMFKAVCDQIWMPISQDKLVGPVQIIEFLGLTLDLILMVVCVPEYKLGDILTVIVKLIKK